MKRKLLFLTLLLTPLVVFAIGSSLRTINTEVITTKKDNQDITITPTGTGDVVLKDYSGFLEASSGTLSATNDVMRLSTSQTVTGNKTFEPSSSGVGVLIDKSSNGTALDIDMTGSGFALDVSGQMTIDNNITMSGTGQLKLPAGNIAQRSGSPAEGMLRFNSELTRFEGYDGSDWGSIGGAGQGGINYIENNDFESNVSDWSVYADAAGTEPVDGTGGSANVTFTRNTSTPLRGNGDGQLTVDAVDRQGEGLAYDFSIDVADQAKKLTISFDYDASDADYADDDIKVFVYDVTNANLIRVNGEDLKAGKGTHYAQFQTAPDSTSYRLILHVASTNASGYDLFIDNVNVGPTKLAFGTIVTDWEDFTLTASWTANTTYDSYYRRVGDSLEIISTISTSGAPTSATLTVTIPFNLSIDTAKVPALDRELGTAWVHDVTESNRTKATVEATDSTTLQFLYIGGSVVDESSPFVFASGDSISFRVSVPIQGWSSNSQISEDLGSRDAVVFGAGNGGTSLTADVTNIDFTETLDTTSSWDGSVFTAPETGYYSIQGVIRLSSGTSLSLDLYLNGSNDRIVGTSHGSSNAVHDFSAFLKLNKGDELSIRSDSNATLSNSSTDHWISITKDQSSQTLFESDVVAARYSSDNSSQSIGTSATDLIFEDLDNDTHGAYNTSTGEYTAPVSGFYQVNAKFNMQTESFSSGDVVRADIVVNGSLISASVTRISATASLNYGADINEIVELNKGDVLKIQGTSSVASNFISDSSFNTFSIARIK